MWHVKEASIRISLESGGNNQDSNIKKVRQVRLQQLVPPGGQCANYNGGTVLLGQVFIYLYLPLPLDIKV